MNEVQMNKSAITLRKKIRRNVGKAVTDYGMIEDGDKILAAISGGKDSFVMLDVLLHMQRVAPIKFDVIAVNLNQNQPGFPEHVLPEYFERNDIQYYVIDKDTYSIVIDKTPEGKTTCSLCSSLRRGTLYQFAEEIGATKIALGHHMDDIVETLLLNMFFNGAFKAMPPKLLSDNKKNIIIRPLAYCREKDIEAIAVVSKFPIIPCNLCGSQSNLQRKKIKSMLADWETVNPTLVESIFHSLKNVCPTQLADTNLFDFINLKIDRSENIPNKKNTGPTTVSHSSF